MKKILLGLLLTLTLFASDPLQYGAYYGDIKVSIKNYNSYVTSNASSAGSVYLYKHNKSNVDYIVETKNSHITTGLKEAKELAKKHKNKYYAIDNVTHEVVITENSIVVMTNYNVLAFD